MGPHLMSVMDDPCCRDHGRGQLVTVAIFNARGRAKDELTQWPSFDSSLALLLSLMEKWRLADLGMQDTVSANVLLRSPVHEDGH